MLYRDAPLITEAARRTRFTVAELFHLSEAVFGSPLVPVVVAVACFMAFAARSLDSPATLVMYAALAFLGFRRLTLGPRWAAVAVGALVLSAVASIAGSALWGFDEMPATAGLVATTIPFALLYFIDVDAKALGVLMMLVVLHAGAILAQALMGWSTYESLFRASGLTFNPNPAAGLLVVGIAFMLPYERARWWTLPLFMALPFTGSRWAVMVLAGLLTLMLASRTVPLRTLVKIVLVAGVVWLAGWPLVSEALRLTAVGDVPSAGLARWYVPTPPGLPPGFSLLPLGAVPTPHMHNVPMRIGIELGVVAGVSWLALTGWALWRRPRGDAVWWTLLAVTVLGLMEYYTWSGQLAPVWWLALGLRMRDYGGTIRHNRVEPSSVSVTDSVTM